MTLAARIGMVLLLAGAPIAPLPAFQNDQGAQTATPPGPASQAPMPGEDKTNSDNAAAPAGSPSTPPPDNSSSQPAATPALARKPKSGPHSAAKTPVNKTPLKKNPRHHVAGQPQVPKKVVVRNGGASDSQAQISPGRGTQQTSQQRTNMNSMLAATTANLSELSGRQLNSDQQDMVRQIRSYMEQSKAAASAGDLQGANNLAVKAHLLSEELVKR